MNKPGDDDGAAAASLVARIRRGDASAEDELVSRYRPGVKMLLRKLLKDAALADDYSQEVFRAAIQSLRQGQLADGTKLAAYLWSIVRNLANSELRRRYRQPADAAVDPIAGDDARPDQQLLREERRQLLRKAIGALSTRDRKVLSAFYLSEVPKEAICLRFGLSPSQFDVIKWRALKRLRTLLQKHGEW